MNHTLNIHQCTNVIYSKCKQHIIYQQTLLVNKKTWCLNQQEFIKKCQNL